MFKQTLFLDIWTALYQLAIAARSNQIAALVLEETSYRVTYARNVTPAAIQSLGNLNPHVIIVNGLITKNDLATHHSAFLDQELKGKSKYY